MLKMQRRQLEGRNAEHEEYQVFGSRLTCQKTDTRNSNGSKQQHKQASKLLLSRAVALCRSYPASE